MSEWWTKHPLPENWEMKYDWQTKRFFFIDHQNKKTTWQDPRKTLYNKDGTPNCGIEPVSESSSEINETSSEGSNIDLRNLIAQELQNEFDIPITTIEEALAQNEDDASKTRRHLKLLLLAESTSSPNSREVRLKYEEEAKKRLEQGRKAQEEEERKRLEQEQAKLEEEERRHREQQQKKVEEEQLRKCREQQQKKAQEEEFAKKVADEEQRWKLEEEERTKKTEVEKKKKFDEEKRKRQDDERHKQAEVDRRRKNEEDRRMKEEENRRKRKEDEREIGRKTEAPKTNSEGQSSSAKKVNEITKVDSSSPFYKGPNSSLSRGPDPALWTGPNQGLVEVKPESIAKGPNPANLGNRVSAT